MAANLSCSERVVAVAVVVVSCLLCLQHACAAPRSAFLPPAAKEAYPPTVVEDLLMCSHDAEVETLCQRCAKYTKSNMVYPMCCGDREEAREWCKSYIDFGISTTPDR